jgi:hypothetical protein
MVRSIKSAQESEVGQVSDWRRHGYRSLCHELAGAVKELNISARAGARQSRLHLVETNEEKWSKG